MNSTPISRREAQVIYEVKDREMIFFTVEDIKRFLQISINNTYRVLINMEKKGLALRLEKGRYILKDDWEKLDIYEIASNLLSASYLGFWSALHFHKLTDQVPRKIFIATTKRKRSLKIQTQPVKFITITKKAFFGYEKYGRVVASDVEKTIIDSLRLPKYSGGIDQVYNAFENDFDIEKIIDYCLIINSSAVTSRLGFFLEQKGVLKNTAKLVKNITTYSKLDPTGKEVNPNPHWKLYINRRLE